MNKIDCPFCGPRDVEEFHYGGDASKRRPAPEVSDISAWVDFVYLRDNPDGFHTEFWYHETGCRSYLVMERNTTNHEVRSVRIVQDHEEGEA